MPTSSAEVTMASFTGTIDDAVLPRGPQGASAYEVWQAAGNTGTPADFLASLKGDKGDKGDPGVNGLKTVLDFGAAGNLDADDAPAFNAALAWSEANQLPVVVPPLGYKIGAPIAVTTTKNHFYKWGLVGLGGRLHAAFSDPAS